MLRFAGFRLIRKIGSWKEFLPAQNIVVDEKGVVCYVIKRELTVEKMEIR
jgi:hypothetical protein